MSPPIPESVRRELRARYANGELSPQIARELGISVATVTNHTRDLRNQPHSGPRHIQTVTPEIQDEIRKLRTQGIPRPLVAEKLGISEHTVKRFDPTKRPHNYVTPTDKQKIHNLRAQGYTITQVAALTGFGTSTIFRYDHDRIRPTRSTPKATGPAAPQQPGKPGRTLP